MDKTKLYFKAKLASLTKVILGGILTALAFWMGGQYPQLENIITGIIIFGVPVLNYFLFKSFNISLLFLLFCLKIGNYFLPLESSFAQFFFANTYIKIAILAYVLFKIGSLIYVLITEFYQEIAKENEPRDYFFIIQKIFQKTYAPNITYANFIAHEFAVLAYGLFLWKKPKVDDNHFSYTQTSGNVIMYSFLVLIAIIETACVHLMLYHFHLFVPSLILLFLNLYTGLYLIAHLKAMTMRPIFLDKDTLLLKNGLFANAKIDLKNIAFIENTEREIDFERNTKVFKMALLKKLEPHNMKVLLRKDSQIDLFYGIKKTVSEIYFYVDNPKFLLEKIKIAEDDFHSNNS